MAYVCLMALPFSELHAAVVTQVVTLLPDWLDPQVILTSAGDIAFWVVVAIIFAECGILVGFFLPGDSLLFATGLFIASGYISMNIWLAALVLTIAAFAGNLVGYWVGYKVGPPLFSRPNSRLFKQEYVDHTQTFFKRFGGRAIIIARFTPIVRTFITAMAGVARMDFRQFALFSGIGAIFWAGAITTAGYFLGTIPWVKDNFELVLLALVFLSILPILWEFVKHRRQTSTKLG
jgi:membrane-associated protein